MVPRYIYWFISCRVGINIDDYVVFSFAFVWLLVKNSVARCLNRNTDEQTSWHSQYAAGIRSYLLHCTDFPDAPSSVSVRYKSSTIVCLDVEPPADDGGEPIIGYRVDYDQGKVLEFQTGMSAWTEMLHWWLCFKKYFFAVCSRWIVF